MGNINYKNFVCDNYYCQSVSFKPEWLSENSWKINYKYKNKDDNNKPYVIDKGILKITDVDEFSILLSKKLLIDLNNFKNIVIPINFKYFLKNNNNIDIFFVFSNMELVLENMNELINTDNTFYIHMNVTKNKVCIYRSFNNKIISKKIKSKKINTLMFVIENNFQMLLITEKLYNNIKIFYEEKFLNTKKFDLTDNFYLNLYIKNNQQLIKKEFIELNFE
jgi:hypothetical protein